TWSLATCSSSPDAGTAASAAARMIHANRGKGDCAVDMVRDASTTIGLHPRVVQHPAGDAIDSPCARQAEDNSSSCRRATKPDGSTVENARANAQVIAGPGSATLPGWNCRDGSARRCSAVERTQHATRATIQHMRIDLRRRHILVAEQLLDRANVVARFKQVGSEAVAQGMRRDRLCQAGALRRAFYRALQDILVEVVAFGAPVPGVAGTPRGRKHVLPMQGARRAGVLARQRMRQGHFAETQCQI